MLGKEITLHRSSDSGSTFGSAIADVWSIQIGEITAETIENQAHGASTDFKEYEYGMKDGGETAIVIRYKAGQTDAEALADALHNSTKEHLQLQFPAPINKSVSFRCLVTKVGVATEQGALVERSFTLKVDGAPTEATIS
ncbi:phage tail tube protein [Glaciecola sp. KUL10]|uniref:phage tail tube protein n=1 Tax=Glaciecola sp. (strain KUL10) TaxID=2161813 RepID=UPI000D789088|nr:phage tail tube protein [Glaciecola sp. KUL10]GBL02932.1 hypothetical protein KUL10_02050 [Glaciecola sp. KUL10]